MPRPGPRPYECVRRAWHSHSHQPIRGSLIQEIFRVVNEIHCSLTKKNKEWQEKLPVVVLRAEEILYSKANSEAEYMDSKTLWDRIHDAINTIIRRDENTETGQFLQPCIEAALNLGCTPRRASRSERNSNPTCYLSSSSQKPPTMPPCIVHTNWSPHMPYLPNLSNPNSAPPGLNAQTFVSSNSNCSIGKFLTALESVVPSPNTQYFSTQSSPASNLVSLYPLYYGNGNCRHIEERQHGFDITHRSNSRAADLTCMGNINNLRISDVNTLDDIHKAGTRYALGSLCNSWCDLSLRLGPPSAPCLSFKNSPQAHVKEDGVSSSCREGVKFLDQSRCFFPWSNAANDSSRPYLGIGSFGDGKVAEAVTTQKRKQLSVNHFAGNNYVRSPSAYFENDQ